MKAETTAANPEFDVVVVGAGPAGLCGALSLASAGLRVCVVERQARELIAAPPFDGREIALTHRSLSTLGSLGVWERLDAADIAPLRDAIVMNMGSGRRLSFDHRDAGCEALGYLVPNHAIRQAAYAALAADGRAALLCDRRVTDVRFGADGVRITTSQGDELSARLLVAADSRFSDMRRAAGIAADMVDFGKSMLVCRMAHERPHDQTAWEWFQEKCTVALLPLNGNQASAVITVPQAEALRLQGLDEEAFARDIEARFERRLGAMQLVSTRHVYPLVATWSRRFVAPRFALIGDAAVGMHPVTAHGFNLGLLSQQLLARELGAAHGRGGDAGELAALLRYESAHRRRALPLYSGTNAIVRLYTDARPLHRIAREFALGLADRIHPVKRLMMASLTERTPAAKAPPARLQVSE